MDGTLIDSEILCNQAFKDLIPQIDVPVESLVASFSGRKLAWIFSEIEKRFSFKLSKDIEQHYGRRVEELFDSELAAFSGVHDALEGIELPICIATSAPIEKVNHALSKTGLKKSILMERSIAHTKLDLGNQSPIFFCTQNDK